MSLSCLIKTKLSVQTCHLCLCRNFQRAVSKGKIPVRRVDKPIRVPTPPRLVVVPFEPLVKYSDEFQEQALKNINDWIKREEHCELFDEEEKRTYELDYENYKQKYIKWIEGYQNELSSEQHNQDAMQSGKDSKKDLKDWDEILELSAKWNSSIQAEREIYIDSLQSSLKVRTSETVTGSEKPDYLEMIDSPLLDSDYLSQLIEVKLKRLENIITEDNLDVRIAAALNDTPIEFNFAIDTNGDVHKGAFFDKAKTMGSSRFGSSLIRKDVKQDISSNEDEPLSNFNDIVVDDLLEELSESNSSESVEQFIKKSSLQTQTDEMRKNDDSK